MVRVVRGLRSRAASPSFGPTTLDSAASAPNLFSVVALPIAWFGRMEGGFPKFVSGTPRLVQAGLYPIPLTGAFAAVSTITTWRAWQKPTPTRLLAGRTVVSMALLAFTAFASYWDLWTIF